MQIKTTEDMIIPFSTSFKWNNEAIKFILCYVIFDFFLNTLKIDMPPFRKEKCPMKKLNHSMAGNSEPTEKSIGSLGRCIIFM